MALAQATEIATPTTIIGAFIFVALALVGLIGWILKHLFLTTIPGILADAKEQRECHERTVEIIMADAKAERESHESTVATTIANAKTETASERALCDKRFDLVDAALAALTTATAKAADGMTAAINAHTTDQTGKYRHDMYDAINRAVMMRDLYLAQKQAEDQAAADEADRRKREGG